ncbi:MAG: type VI secretion system baseplate subunit TssG, partial [Gemmataceae bacterium]
MKMSCEELLYDPELACTFEPFQAVRFLELLMRQEPRFAGQEIDRLIRFRGNVTMAFPPSALAAILPPRNYPMPTGSAEPLKPSAQTIRQRYTLRDQPIVVQNFFSVFGPNGTLPITYTRLLCELDSDKDYRKTSQRAALREWLDQFNHRMTVLLYKAWQKYRMPVGFFRTQWNITTPMLPESRRVDKITHVTQCLLGFGLPSLQGQLRVEAPGGRADNDTPLVRFPDLALLHYGGAFARRRPSLYELGAILSDYFHLPAEVIPLTGQWLLLPREAQTQLGMEGGGILGENVVAGERIWDVNSMFRLRLGPLRYRQFIEYLPDPTPQPERKGGNLVAQLTRLYVGAEFDFE